MTTKPEVLLLDLDNTLIHNPDRAFALGFLQLAEAHFQATLGFPGVAQIIRQSIRAMLAEHAHPTTSALQTHLIAEAASVPPERVTMAWQAFYRELYPQLRANVQPVKGVVDLLHALKGRGYRLVIATNPLYPASGVYQRMAWGGLPGRDFFEHITHSQNARHAKPHPAYYAQLLHHLGVPAARTWMIGDSPRNDIAPAHAAGMTTFYIADEPSNTPPPEAHASGSLMDLAPLLTD